MNDESTSTFIFDLKNKNLLSVSHLPENSDSALGLTQQAPGKQSKSPSQDPSGLQGKFPEPSLLGVVQSWGLQEKMYIEALSLPFAEHLLCARFLSSSPHGDQLINDSAVLLPTCHTGESSVCNRCGIMSRH